METYNCTLATGVRNPSPSDVRGGKGKEKKRRALSTIHKLARYYMGGGEKGGKGREKKKEENIPFHPRSLEKKKRGGKKKKEDPRIYGGNAEEGVERRRKGKKKRHGQSLSELMSRLVTNTVKRERKESYTLWGYRRLRD